MPRPPVPMGVHLRRCARHSAREAAARCPVCGSHFCRECVVEHQGRLLCAPCLAKQVAVAQPARERWRAWRRSFGLVAAVVVAWLAFYATGSLLLRVPPQFHDGTIWTTLEVPDEAP